MGTPAEAKATGSSTPEAAGATTPNGSERPAGWIATYDQTISKLPPALATRLPTGETAAKSVALAQDKLAGFGEASKQQWTEASKFTAAKANALREAAAKNSPAKIEWLKQAWSVTNETQVPLNISLNQVGPLYFEVVAPGDTFERRIPNVWHLLEVRPYTSPSTAYNAWSTTWPILCVTGPAVAATSLLAIPIVAVAAGGSALASLTAFGSSIGAAVSSATAGAVEGVSATAATVTAAAAKANRLPGASRVRGKLADAARNLVRDQVGRQEVQQRVIRYLTNTAGAGAAAAYGAGAGAEAQEGRTATLENAQEQDTSQEGQRKRLKRDFGGEAVRTRGNTGKKLDEVDVTGHDMERVLLCATGNTTVDKELAKAFKRLSFKTKFGEFKTQDNPVLRIIGGPELETRTPEPSLFRPHPSPRQILVFHPFILVRRTDLVAEPISPSEVPPTESESRLISEAKVVESYAEAEKVAEKTGKGEDLEEAVKEAQEEFGTAHVAETGAAGTEQVTVGGVAAAEQGEAPAKALKKGWFGRW
ncbi:hypothetical protein JCM10908_005763 [Rhodotorula pacifica]|uniref:uncharacterized protein n=1 Tax=Rhodotorula pacifica TaxID=1495444 RepID=UPI00317F4FB1